jgi:hypothetical protein
MDNPDLIVKILAMAAEGNAPHDFVRDWNQFVTAIVNMSPAERAAAYTVALTELAATLPERTPQTSDDGYNKLVNTQWDNLKMLLNAIAQQQNEQNHDWAAMFDTLVQVKYSVTANLHQYIQERAAAYTVALQWFGVPLPERTIPETIEDGYNISVINHWNALRMKRTNYGRMCEIAKEIDQALWWSNSDINKLISDIKDPHTNPYMPYGNGTNIVNDLVKYSTKAFNKPNKEFEHKQRVTNVMLDCWVALVGRPDYNSIQDVEHIQQRSLLTYVVGDMQTMIGLQFRLLADDYVFYEVWDKYTTIVNRSVETAGQWKYVNGYTTRGTALFLAIENCSDFGSGGWRNVISTQMVEDMGERPLSNTPTHTHDLRCFSVVAALLNAKHIDVVNPDNKGVTPLYEACSLEFKWPIVVHLLDMLKDEPNNRLNDLMRHNRTTAFQVAAQYSPGAVIALIKQPGLMPNLRAGYTGVTSLDLLNMNYYSGTNTEKQQKQQKQDMVSAALAFVGAVGASKLTDANKNRTVGEYLASKFEWQRKT